MAEPVEATILVGDGAKHGREIEQVENRQKTTTIKEYWHVFRESLMMRNREKKIDAVSSSSCDFAART